MDAVWQVPLLQCTRVARDLLSPPAGYETTEAGTQTSSHALNVADTYVAASSGCAEPVFHSRCAWGVAGMGMRMLRTMPGHVGHAPPLV